MSIESKVFEISGNYSTIEYDLLVASELKEFNANYMVETYIVNQKIVEQLSSISKMSEGTTCYRLQKFVNNNKKLVLQKETYLSSEDYYLLLLSKVNETTDITIELNLNINDIKYSFFIREKDNSIIIKVDFDSETTDETELFSWSKITGIKEIQEDLNYVLFKRSQECSMTLVNS